MKLGKLNHVAIVVPDLGKAATIYQQLLQAKISKPQLLSEHGVRVIFVDFGNTKIELLEPYWEQSPIAKFLETHPQGGMHHVCYEVGDILEAKQHLQNQGARVLGDGQPKIGAHGKPVLFLHPKDFCGTLIELEQV